MLCVCKKRQPQAHILAQSRGVDTPESVNSFLAETIYPPRVLGAVSGLHLLVNHTAPVLRVKVRQVQTRKCGIQPCSNWKDDLWEVWRTPERKPCCDKVHSIVSIIPSPGPHRCKDFHCCTVSCTQARWDVRVTLFEIVFICLASFLESKGSQQWKGKKKEKKSLSQSPCVFNGVLLCKLILNLLFAIRCRFTMNSPTKRSTFTLVCCHLW